MKDTDVEKVFINSDFRKEVIDLNVFNKLNSDEQSEILRTTLNLIYNETLKITKKHIMKCIKLTCVPKDDEIYLPYKLKVERRGNKLIFSFTKKSWIPILLIFIGIIAFGTIGATFSSITMLSRANLNKDIDGDGVPDINIDVDGDYVADINIDTDDDDKPNINVDYKGNRMAIFNVDEEGSLIVKYNRINQDTNNDGVCDLNCDIDGDGWPDINIDYFGEGKAMLDVDTDNDKVPDLNIDTDGDGRCDVMCDTNDDGVCDLNCIAIPKDVIDSGASLDQHGNPSSSAETANILLIYNGGENIFENNIVPDDMGREYTPMPDKIITIENTSRYTVSYSLMWEVTENTFTSNNFVYKVQGTNGAPSFDFIPIPKVSSIFAADVLIPGKTVQKYTISMKLKGINAPQNYDQNKRFAGNVKVLVD